MLMMKLRSLVLLEFTITFMMVGVVSGTASGKNLKSTSDDDVCTFFSDHGAATIPGIYACALMPRSTARALAPLFSIAQGVS